MLADLRQLEATALAELGAAADPEGVEAWRVAYLGVHGRIKAAMGGLKDVPKDQKPAVGQRLNALKSALEQAFEARKSAVGGQKPAAGGAVVDLTEPGLIESRALGRRHIIT